MGNTCQPGYAAMEKLRPTVEKTHESLSSFQFKLHSEMISTADCQRAFNLLKLCHRDLSQVLLNSSVTLSRRERDGLRHNKEMVAILLHIMEGRTVSDLQRSVGLTSEKGRKLFEECDDGDAGDIGRWLDEEKYGKGDMNLYVNPFEDDSYVVGKQTGGLKAMKTKLKEVKVPPVITDNTKPYVPPERVLKRNAEIAEQKRLEMLSDDEKDEPMESDKLLQKIEEVKEEEEEEKKEVEGKGSLKNKSDTLDSHATYDSGYSGTLKAMSPELTEVELTEPVTVTQPILHPADGEPTAIVRETPKGTPDEPLKHYHGDVSSQLAVVVEGIKTLMRWIDVRLERRYVVNRGLGYSRSMCLVIGLICTTIGVATFEAHALLVIAMFVLAVATLADMCDNLFAQPADPDRMVRDSGPRKFRPTNMV